MTAQQQPNYAARVPASIQTPDVVETSRLGRLEFFDGMPSDETVRKVYGQLDFSRAVETFLTGCPAASIHAFLQGMKQAGMGTFSMGITEQLLDARSLWLTPNTTTVYCIAQINVEHGPTVMEVPPGVLGPVDDAGFCWVTDVGFTGPDRGQGGKYLFLPPGHEGEVPGGCYVVRTRTYRNWLLMRAFVIDGDLAKTAAHVKKHWRLYPLKEAASPREPHFVNLSGVQYNTIHANDFSFFEELNAVVQCEPADAFNPELLGLWASIGIKKGEPFAPDERMTRILTEAAAVGNATARALSYRPRGREPYFYEDRQWYTAFVGGRHDFMSNGELMRDYRTMMHYMATGITPAMAQSAVGQGSAYAFTPHDAQGRYLDGGKTYRVTLPAPVPAAQFWSFVVYSGQHRSLLETDQKSAGVDSQSPDLLANPDGSYTVWFAPAAPAGKEGNWVQTLPGKSWSALLRLYAPLEPWFDKTWKPGDFELVDQGHVPSTKVSPELQAISDRAYLYAYGIDEAYKHLYKTLVEPDGPANRFQIIRHLADDKYTAHPTINNDTLHLMGWLDVAAEPVIVSVPDHDDGRYWVLHTMDMGHYTTTLFGKRTRGPKGGRFMFANQTWQGEVPDGIAEVVRVESNFIKLMGRVMATGVEDEKKALSYVDDWNIRTLSEFLGQSGPKPKVRKFVPPMGNSWLERVNFVLADSTMTTADAHWLEGLDASGIGAGKVDFTPEQLAAAEISEQHVLAKLKETLPTLTNASKSLGTREQLGNGDRTVFQVGTYIGQWGAPPEEASYIQMIKDQNGDVLNGASDYSITFTPPPVSQFWSVTAYGSNTKLMIANDLNRHSRGDRHVKLNADGTVTLRLSHDTQGKAEDSNFLPVPNENFYLVLRMYGGDEDVQAGKFPVPVVQKVSK